MTTPPPTTPVGAPPPPVQTAASEAAMLKGVVDALKPMFGTQAPKINTWETRCLVERLLNEKRSHGPLQGSDITVESLFKMATGGWDNPAVKSGALLRAACVILNVSPVPAAPQPPTAQPAATPMWGSFPASLPEVAETTTSDASDTTDTDKAVKKSTKKAAARAAKKAAKKARQRALLCGILAAVAAAAAVIAAATAGWVAFGAAITAVGAGIAGATIGAKTFASTKPQPPAPSLPVR